MASTLTERQRASGVKPMGTAARVHRAVAGDYRDAEVRIRFVRLSAGKDWIADAGASHLLVFGRGRGLANGQPVGPGNLALAGGALHLNAGDGGIESFVVTMPAGIAPTDSVRVLARARLETFAAEGIVVTRGTEFTFSPILDLAEVIVPPGVTTSEHDLGVNERYLLLEGEGRTTLNGHDDAVVPGDVVAIPSGTMQFIANTGTVPLRFYCLCTPPFTVATYGPGLRHGQAPPGFSLEAWWRSHANRYGGVG